MKKFNLLPWPTFLIFFSAGINKVVTDNGLTNPTQPPCPNIPIPPTYNQPVLPSSYQTPSMSLTPYPSATSVACPGTCMSPISCQTCPPCSPYPTISPLTVPCYPTICHYPTTYPTSPPRPENITKCPPGTIDINGVCRLIYCGAESIYREGKCLRIECPEGTYWTESRCQMISEPIIHTIAFNSTMTTHVNSMNSPVLINNINNVSINSTSTNNLSDSSPTTCENCEIDPEETTDPPNCCTVVTPRICKPKIDGNRKKWHCYSKRYRRCGDFCVASTMLLKPPYPSGTENVTVLPPDNYLTDCRQSRTCVDSNDMYDCSGCVIGRPENCSSYCYRYVCPTRRCKYISQRDFCTQYPSEQGCLEEDGCFEDWCGSY